MLSSFVLYLLTSGYADLHKIVQLLVILILGVPDVGPFLKSFTWIGLSKCFFDLVRFAYMHRLNHSVHP